MDGCARSNYFSLFRPEPQPRTLNSDALDAPTSTLLDASNAIQDALDALPWRIYLGPIKLQVGFARADFPDDKNRILAAYRL
jgi:hypothetical protein